MCISRRFRLLFASLLAGLWAFGTPGPAAAQQTGPVTIEQVQVGFGSTPGNAFYKAGFWTPLYLDLVAWPDRPVPEGEVIVEASDSDDVRSRYTVRLPALQPKEHFTALTAYSRPSGMDSDITITIKIDGKTVARKSLDNSGIVHSPLPSQDHLYLSLGSGLQSLRSALKRARPNAPNQPEQTEDLDSGDTGPQHVVSLEDIRWIPNRWFAYEPVDLLIFPTGNREGFLMSLLSEREDRKKAIAEWVRRGGHLVVSVGRNQDVLKDKDFDAIETMLPVKLAGTKEVPRLSLESWRSIENSSAAENNGARPPFEIARFEPKPDRAFEILLKERDNKLPVVVRGPYGMGQVTVVAFDLDQRPFSSWDPDSSKTFWKWLLTKTASPPPSENDNNRSLPPGLSGRQETPDLATQLETRLEDFEDVPVISFGWVALFILVYILIVGPLDYLFLKKVVKRLELTWITFPTVVITISVAAYFTAYWIKGNDQKINKVDLLNIDLQTQQVYGSSWFTIFSPRIQHYTIGLEPASPGWAPPAQASKPGPGVVLTYLGRPDESPGGSNRPQSQGLFRRAYDYAPDAAALLGVPIQVWSTKSFTAAWEAPLDGARPLISSDVRLVAREGNKHRLAGSITSHLPAELTDVALFYNDHWYAIGQLSPNAPYPINEEKLPANPSLTDQWVGTVPQNTVRQQSASGTRNLHSGSASPTIGVLKKLLFFQGSERNNGLRYLNESWRVQHHESDLTMNGLTSPDQMILFGRLARQDGPAEEVTSNQSNPTQLWLGAAPAPGVQRPLLNGTLDQETYVNVIIPVPHVSDKP
jgi:hypothetical protein